MGRPRKGEVRDNTQDYLDECERVEVERKFSLAKRKCGMGLVTAKLRETAAHVMTMSVLVLNLRKIQCTLLPVFAVLLGAWMAQRKLAFVQETLLEIIAMPRCKQPCKTGLSTFSADMLTNPTTLC